MKIVYCRHIFLIQGYCTKISPKLKLNETEELPHTDLILFGVGMRKVTILYMDFHVYLVGVHISQSTLINAQEWVRKRPVGISLSNALLSIPSSTSTSTITTIESIKLSATLRFHRYVAKSDFLEAFNIAFHDCNKDEVIGFINTLGHLVDDTGM